MQQAGLLFIISIFTLSACQHNVTEDINQTGSYPIDDIEVGSKILKKHHYTGNTYQWAGSEIAVNDPSGVWHTPDFNYEEHISSAIKKQLRDFGLVESSNSDISFSYDIKLNMSAIKVKSFSGTNEQFVFHRPESIFSIHIKHKNSKDTLWTGWTNTEYKKLAPETSTKRIDYAIREILKKLPLN